MNEYLDGPDIDFKTTVRDYFTKDCRVHATGAQRHNEVIKQLQAFAGEQLISVAQVRTQPIRFVSLYEVAATVSLELALCASSHYTFSQILASRGQSYHLHTVLPDADRGKTIGCCAIAELTNDTLPYQTTAMLDCKKDEFVIDSYNSKGTKVPVVNALSAEWAIVAADLVVDYKSHGVHLFLVQLRDPQTKATRPGVHIRAVHYRQP